MKTQTNPKITQTNPKKAGLKIREGHQSRPGWHNLSRLRAHPVKPKGEDIMKTQATPKVTQTNRKKAGLKVRTGIKAGPGGTTCPDCWRSR